MFINGIICYRLSIRTIKLYTLALHDEMILSERLAS